MSKITSTPDFSIKVSGVKGHCPAGENWAKQNIAENKTPVLSCEGPCIRGEIARLAANIVAVEAPYARCCINNLVDPFFEITGTECKGDDNCHDDQCSYGYEDFSQHKVSN